MDVKIRQMLDNLYLTPSHTVSFLFYFAVSANEGDAYPLGALPVGILVNNLEIQPGKGSEYIRAAGNLLFACFYLLFPKCMFRLCVYTVRGLIVSSNVL